MRLAVCQADVTDSHQGKALKGRSRFQVPFRLLSEKALAVVAGWEMTFLIQQFAHRKSFPGSHDNALGPL